MQSAIAGLRNAAVIGLIVMAARSGPADAVQEECMNGEYGDEGFCSVCVEDIPDTCIECWEGFCGGDSDLPTRTTEGCREEIPGCSDWMETD
jgi:hypothetical protein